MDPMVVTFRQICNFGNPNLLTFYFYELTHFLDWMKNSTFHLQYKHSGTLLTLNMKNCLTPKNPKMCDPIIVTLLKMQPDYS